MSITWDDDRLTAAVSAHPGADLYQLAEALGVRDRRPLWLALRRLRQRGGLRTTADGRKARGSQLQRWWPAEVTDAG